VIIEGYLPAQLTEFLANSMHSSSISLVSSSISMHSSSIVL